MKKCHSCTNFAVPGKSRCQKHLNKEKIEKHRQYAKRLKDGNCSKCGDKATKDRILCRRCALADKKRTENLKRLGLCIGCSKPAVKGILVCKNCRNKKMIYYRDKKLIVLARYSKGDTRKCCWHGCDVTDPDMLTIDHINDDGAEHRKENGRNIYVYLTSCKFLKGFQTLCFNHQWKKRMLGLRENL